MQLKHAIALAAATSFASAATCANDSCLKAVKLAGGSLSGSPAWWDCYFARRVTTTPAAYTAWKTVWKTVSTTSTAIETKDVSSTTTLSFTATEWITNTENPTITTSTTSTVQPWAGHGGTARKRKAEPLPTAHADLAARAPLGHFPLSVAEAAETGAPSKRSARAFGYVPRDSVASKEQSANVDKRTIVDAALKAVCGTNDKYLSACSCAGVPQTTITAVRQTVTSTATSTATSSFQTTSTSTHSVTISLSVTQTDTSTTTTTITSTSTYSTSVMASPTCATFSKGPTADWQYTYKLEYAGFKTLNDNSPANNAGAPAITQVLDGSLAACDAAEDCVAWAATQFSPLGGGYFTTNLRFRPESTNWLCVAYYDQTPASYYNVDSPGVGQSFGWTKRP